MQSRRVFRRALVGTLLAGLLLPMLGWAMPPYGPWYYPNVNWPSPFYHFTSTDGLGAYRVYYPFGNGDSYLVTPADLIWVRRRATTALVEVRVPTVDAAVTVEGVLTTQQGAMRRFATPPLAPGESFVYEIQARWVGAEQVITRTQRVTVRAGQRVVVDFTAAAR